MTAMAVRTELSLRLPNSPGSLADVLKTMAAERVRVAALFLDAAGTLRLVVDNPSRAEAALTRQHMKVTAADVIWTLVPGRSIDTILSLAATAGINVNYAYAASPGPDGILALILGVDDAMRAAAAAGL
jgi:hypothetical protein